MSFRCTKCLQSVIFAYPSRSVASSINSPLETVDGDTYLASRLKFVKIPNKLNIFESITSSAKRLPCPSDQVSVKSPLGSRDTYSYSSTTERSKHRPKENRRRRRSECLLQTVSITEFDEIIQSINFQINIIKL